MHKLYELKDMLCEELEEYGSKGKLDVGSLDVVDKLAHAVKNIDKIIECMEDEEYSNANGMGMREGRGGSYEGYYEGSYARGRGRNARRDSMGRYSREGYSRGGDFHMELEELMKDAPNERIKQKLQSIMSDM